MQFDFAIYFKQLSGPTHIFWTLFVVLSLVWSKQDPSNWKNDLKFLFISIGFLFLLWVKMS